MRAGKTLGAGVLILATISPIQERAEAAGRSTTAVVNTILNGRGAPKNSIGIDGDFYIDTRSLLIYGPKAKGKWPTPQSIQGPTGPSGSDGRNGSDGKTVSTSNVNTVVGPQGIQGVIGPAGPQGEKGEEGLPGVAGASGVPGPAGASGINGAQGPAGPVGPAGATGAKGETGTSGSSEVAVIDIPTWALSSSAPYSFSTSASFGLLELGVNYKFEIYIYGTSDLANLVLGLDVMAANATTVFSYIRSDARYSTYNSSKIKYSFLVSGTISQIQGTTGLNVRIIDAYGETGGGVLTLTGKAYITPVGAIK